MALDKVIGASGNAWGEFSPVQTVIEQFGQPGLPHLMVKKKLQGFHSDPIRACGFVVLPLSHCEAHLLLTEGAPRAGFTKAGGIDPQALHGSARGIRRLLVEDGRHVLSELISPLGVIKKRSCPVSLRSFCLE
eukprot:s1357_g16.t1